jgi:hypothetical protein
VTVARGRDAQLARRHPVAGKGWCRKPLLELVVHELSGRLGQ